MNEHETNPQRHETPATPESSGRPADATPADAPVTPVSGAGPEQRGGSEPTAAQPTVQQAAVQPPMGQQHTAEQPTMPPPVSGTPLPPASPWAAPQHQPGPPPQPGQAYGHPQPPQPGRPQWPGAQQHPGYPGQPQQGPHQPQQGPHQPQQGPHQPQQGPHQAQQGPQGPPLGPPQGPQQPLYPGAYQPAGQQAPWAAPVGTEARPANPGRGRRIFVAGAAAVLIALAGGGIGAATVLAMDDNGGSSAVKTGNSSVTRVVDRSSLAQIAAEVQDSVVSITTGSGEGSGVVLNTNGDIVTNNHVVATAQGDTVNVIFADGKKATATIVGTDPRTDLAVIRATGVSDLKPATLGDSAQMQVGDTVLALGSPLGLEGSVTAGIVSAKDRTIRAEAEQPDPQDQQGGGQQQQPQSGAQSMSGLLQTDAPINPGNSGGALVNTNGQVIGINSAIYTSGGGQGNIGLGFAIPSNKVKQVVDALIAGKKVSHPALGVSVTEGENGGALVRTVTPAGAAAGAGIQQGDVISSVNGKAVNDSDDLIMAIQSASVGDKVTIAFTRNGAQKTVSATLKEAG